MPFNFSGSGSVHAGTINDIAGDMHQTTNTTHHSNTNSNNTSSRTYKNIRAGDGGYGGNVNAKAGIGGAGGAGGGISINDSDNDSVFGSERREKRPEKIPGLRSFKNAKLGSGGRGGDGDSEGGGGGAGGSTKFRLTSDADYEFDGIEGGSGGEGGIGGKGGLGGSGGDFVMEEDEGQNLKGLQLSSWAEIARSRESMSVAVLLLAFALFFWKM